MPRTWPVHAAYRTTSNETKAPGGAECAIVTPIAKTSTPSHGAHHPRRASELENAGSGPVRGRVYTFTPRPLTDAMDWMVDVGAGWDDRLKRLKRQVEWTSP